MIANVKMVRMPGAKGDCAPVPAYETEGAAGMDLRAFVRAFSDEWQDGGFLIEPGGRALIPTGWRMQIPPGFEAQIRPRSGLALKHGITVLNAPGTIDSDYRGEVKVMLHNAGGGDFMIAHGDRIAQMVICPVARAELEIVDALDESGRGAGGFGSTGIG